MPQHQGTSQKLAVTEKPGFAPLSEMESSTNAVGPRQDAVLDQMASFAARQLAEGRCTGQQRHSRGRALWLWADRGLALQHPALCPSGLAAPAPATLLCLNLQQMSTTPGAARASRSLQAELTFEPRGAAPGPAGVPRPWRC